MFSAEDNSYPNLSSYQLSPSSSSFTFPESNNIFLQHPLNLSHDILQGSFSHFPFLLNPPVSESSILNNIMLPDSTMSSSLEASITQENTINCPLSSGKKPPPPMKKDRHTKISTAQGVRDRRVRLSIDIAREFFSLQDLLGFDKASKTLGWLLSKSKAAIDELASSSSNKSGGTPNSSSSPASQDHVNEAEDDLRHALGLNKSSSKHNKREGIRNGESVEREMRRAKARERARERTNYKKKMTMNIGNAHHNDPRAQQNSMIRQPCSGDAPHNYNNSSCGMIYNQQDMTSVGDKSKLRSGSSSYYHNNCDQIYPRLDDHQEGFNNHYNNDYLMKLALECNNGNIHPHGFSALNIIDHQSTDQIHMNTKQVWDNRGNRILQ